MTQENVEIHSKQNRAGLIKRNRKKHIARLKIGYSNSTLSVKHLTEHYDQRKKTLAYHISL